MSKLNDTIKFLKQGKVILYPSDTIWGIGCDARDSTAVQKLYTIKKRSIEKPMVVLISDLKQLAIYVKEVPEIAWDLVNYAENPLTIIYPNGKNVAPELLGKDGSLAIRVVKREPCKSLVHSLERALVSTSANISGSPSPKNFSLISEHIKQEVDYIYMPDNYIDASTSPSTLIELGLDGSIKFLRK